MTSREKKIKFLLLLLEWKELTHRKEMIHDHKTWTNDKDQVIWCVNYHDHEEIYYLFCKSKKNLYLHDWVNLSSIDNLEDFLGAQNESESKPESKQKIKHRFR